MRKVNKKFSASSLIIIANTITLLVSNLWPLYIALQFEGESGGEHSKKKANFQKLLQNVNFRYIASGERGGRGTKKKEGWRER